MGRDLWAARFLGERGSLSTYGQKGSLLAYDLIDPNRAAWVGELERGDGRLRPDIYKEASAPLRSFVSGELLFGVADSVIVSARLAEPSEILGTVRSSPAE